MTDRDKELEEILARRGRRVYEEDRFHYQEYIELTVDERDAMVKELMEARSLLTVVREDFEGNIRAYGHHLADAIDAFLGDEGREE